MKVKIFALKNMSENKSKTKKIKTSCHRIGNYVYWTPKIGKGSFSRVYIGKFLLEKHQTTLSVKAPDMNDVRLGDIEGEFVAVKKILAETARKLNAKRLLREIEILKQLDHPNIVKFVDSFTDVASNIYIITEFCNRGDLDMYTKTEWLDETQVRNYIRQLRDGLKYLFDKQILHRDLKPANLLLHYEGASGKIILKIADFGLAKTFSKISAEESLSATFCGTPYYLAPEMITKPHKYTIYSDLWPIGVIIYQLWCHMLPFRKKNGERLENFSQLDDCLQSFILSWPRCGPKGETLNIPPEVKLLVSNLLTVDPLKRGDWGNFFDCDWLDDRWSQKSMIQSMLFESQLPTDNNLENSNIDIIKHKLFKEEKKQQTEEHQGFLSPFDLKEDYFYNPLYSPIGINSCPDSRLVRTSLSNSPSNNGSIFSVFSAVSTMNSNSPVLKYINDGFGVLGNNLMESGNSLLKKLSSFQLNDEAK